LYKQDGLTGGHVIMLGADAASKSAAIEALHAYPGKSACLKSPFCWLMLFFNSLSDSRNLIH